MFRHVRWLEVPCTIRAPDMALEGLSLHTLCMMHGLHSCTHGQQCDWVCPQVPWQALQSRPAVVEMSDVWLLVSLRIEDEREEDLTFLRLSLQRDTK